MDTETVEAWLWLSRQVATILAGDNPLPSIPLASTLLSALKSIDFVASRGGLNAAAMARALGDRFNAAFLRDLRVEAWCDPQPGAQRPSRVLTRSVTEGKRIPNVLRALLLTRLVADDISVLWGTAIAPQARAPRIPIGYGRRGSSARQRLGKHAIQFAVKAAGGKITVAAQLLGVSSYGLAADMLHHGMHLPLSIGTARRLGEQRINAVCNALRDGMPKKEIERHLDISAWSIVLIQLNDTELRDVHRMARVARQRQTHRNILLAYRQQYPAKSRNMFTKEHAGSFDWLREYDRKWMESHLPAPARGGRERVQRSRKNWTQIDQAAAAVVRKTASDEIARTGRPTRLTRTRLLREAGALAAMGKNSETRYPTAFAEAELLAESKEEFLRRTIRWALQEYANRHIPISINQLRRVARLAAGVLLEQRSYVIEVAEELGLAFDARSSLSPLQQQDRLK